MVSRLLWHRNQIYFGRPWNGWRGLWLRLDQRLRSLFLLPLQFRSPILALRVWGVYLAISDLANDLDGALSFLWVFIFGLLFLGIWMRWRQQGLSLIFLSFRDNLVLLKERAQNKLILIRLEKFRSLLIILLALNEWAHAFAVYKLTKLDRLDWRLSVFLVFNNLGLDFKILANLNLINVSPGFFEVFQECFLIKHDDILLLTHVVEIEKVIILLNLLFVHFVINLFIDLRTNHALLKVAHEINLLYLLFDLRRPLWAWHFEVNWCLVGVCWRLCVKSIIQNILERVCIDF